MKKQRSYKAHANTVKGVEKYLNNSSFNEEDSDNFKYQAEYESLYEKVVVKKIFKHFNINPNNDTDLSFNYFENDHDNRGWQGVFCQSHPE